MCPCESRNVMVTGPSCCHHHQTGKLPDKALIITSRHSRVITPHYHVLCEWKQASHHSDDNDDDQDDTQCEWTLERSSHWLMSSCWRKLNHLLIEDDKEPTHLCYPQWSHQPHNDNTTISEQSAKHHPAVLSCPPLNCQWDIDPGSNKKREAFPREWIYLNSFYTIRYFLL